MIIFSSHGPSSSTTGRSAFPKRFGRLATPTLNDERDFGAGLLAVRAFCLSYRAEAFSECEGGSGTRSDVEADEEVAEESLAARRGSDRPIVEEYRAARCTGWKEELIANLANQKTS
jgi:hypothetical protein